MKILRGAARTIERHSPVVIVEDNGLTVDDEPTGASIEWLRERGYRKVAKHRHDVVLAKTEEE